MGSHPLVWLVLAGLSFLIALGISGWAASAMALPPAAWGIAVLRRFARRGTTVVLTREAVSLRRDDRVVVSVGLEDLEFVSFRSGSSTRTMLGLLLSIWGVLLARLISDRFTLRVAGVEPTIGFSFSDVLRRNDTILEILRLLATAIARRHLDCLESGGVVRWTPRLALAPDALLLTSSVRQPSGDLEVRRRIPFDQMQSISIKHGHLLVRIQGRQRHAINHSPQPHGIESAPGFLAGWLALKSWLEFHEAWGHIRIKG